MLIGYVRYVSNGADETSQLKMMMDRSVSKVFSEQTGSRAAELRARQDLLNFAREGDSVIVDSLQVIARSIGELLDVIQQLAERGVTFISVSEDIDTGNDQGKFLLKVFKAMSGLDTDSIVGQQRDKDARDLAAKAAQEARSQQPPQSKVLTPPAGGGKNAGKQDPKPEQAPPAPPAPQQQDKADEH